MCSVAAFLISKLEFKSRFKKLFLTAPINGHLSELLKGCYLSGDFD